MSKIEYKGNWAIEKIGKSAYRVVNEKVGLQFRANYKKNVEKIIKDTEKDLQKEPSAVPKPCERTYERQQSEAQQAWDDKTKEEKLAAIDDTVVNRLRLIVQRIKRIEQEAQDKGILDYIRDHTSGHRMVDLVSADSYKLALQCDSMKERQAFMREEEKRLRKQLMKIGYSPNYADPWDRAWQYIRYRANLQIHDEFEALLGLYDQCDG